MNPASPIQPVNVLRVPQKLGERKQKDARTADDFHRAMQQHTDGEASGTPAAPQQAKQDPTPPLRPMPRGLQPARLFSRREPEPELRHVDVIA
jgi:hypothetical protein